MSIDGTHVNMPEPDVIRERRSDSSEELINTSDESMNFNDPNQILVVNPVIPIHTDAQNGVAGGALTTRDGDDGHMVREAQPEVQLPPQTEPTPEERSRQLVRQAEKSKARLLEVPGMHNSDIIDSMEGQFKDKLGVKLGDMLHSVMVDETYSSIAAHVEEGLKRRIVSHEYVDFARLIPRSRIQRLEDEDRGLQQVVNKGGFMFCLPPGESRDQGNSTSMITSFWKWEQAFRIFTHIYTNSYPTKAAELMQYCHIIHDASLSFPWENVYAYDRDFRMHISQNVGRSWAMILNQAWTFYMKEKSINSTIYATSRGNDRRQGNGSSTSKRDREVCWKFNSGRCTFGLSCKFDHRCALCSKFGHGSHICRRATQNNSSRGHNSDRETGERYHNDRYHYYRSGNGSGNGNGNRDRERDQHNNQRGGKTSYRDK